jgi:signal transduction histidine kinase
VVTLFAAALTLRRVSPGAALVVAWVAACAQMLMLRELQPADAAVFVIVYSTSAHGSRAVRWWGLGSAGAGALLATIYLGVVVPLVDGAGALPPADLAGRLMWGAVLFGAALAGLVLAWTIGLLTRTVRDSREQRRRAELDRREREHAEYRVVVEQERTRIARDMHDVVAHSLAVVIAQADGARYAGARSPQVQSDALGTISDTARSALAEVRLLLTQLRQEETEGPQPSLDDLPGLIAGMRSAGLSIAESVSGTPVPLLQVTSLAAYRVLQEALTNALRHGDPTKTVGVDLLWEEQTLHLRVRNAVRPSAAAETASAGHGIPGMRERAALAGGGLSAGPTSEVSGTYEVTAVFPISGIGREGERTT